MASPNTKSLRLEQAKLRAGTIKDVTPVRNPFPSRENRRRAVSKTMRRIEKRFREEMKQRGGIK